MARRDDAVDAFVERFAGDLEIAGIPRQPARVFVALLATDDGYLSSAQLGERLRISPAAVSAAIRYLVQVHLVRREREPGTRRDRYRVTGRPVPEIYADRAHARAQLGIGADETAVLIFGGLA